MSAWRRGVVFVVVLIGVIAAGYGHTLEAPFVYDDQNTLLYRTPTKHAQLEVGDALSSPRSLAHYTWGLQYRLGWAEPFHYHLGNIALHVLASGLVGLLTWQLASGGPARRQLLAATAALLFASHPLQTEGVTYLSARLGLLAAVLYLLALVSYVTWRQRGRWYFLVVALASGWLALHAKETAYTLPLAVLLVEGLFFSRSWWRSQQRPFVFGAAAVLLVLSLIWIGSDISLPETVQTAHRDVIITPWHFFLTQQVVKVQYLGLLVAPVGQSIDHEVTLATSFTNPAVLSSTVVLAALLALAGYAAWRGQRLGACGVLLWFIALLPESSFYPLTELMVEYRLYLPMAGVAVVAAAGADWAARRWPLRRVAGAVVLVTTGLTVLTYQRNTLWRDPAALWANAAEQVTTQARPYVNQAVILLRRQQYDDAEALLQHALQVEPEYRLIQHNLGVIDGTQGRITAALEHYRLALEAWPDNPLGHFDAGLLYLEAGQIEQAQHHFRRAAALGVPQARDFIRTEHLP